MSFSLNFSNSNITFNYLISQSKNSMIFLLVLLLIALTVLANIFVLSTVILNRKFQNYIHIQYALLALIDLFTGLISMPSLFISTIYEYWPFNKEYCILWTLISFICSSISILITLSISLFHLKSVMKPQYKLKYNFIIIMAIILVWIVPFVFWTSSIVGNINSIQFCFFIHTFDYVLISDLIFFIIPITLLIIIQTLIYNALKKKSKRIIPRIEVECVHIGNSNTQSAIANGLRRVLTSIGDLKRNSSIIGDIFKLNTQKAHAILAIASITSLLLSISWIIIW